MSKKSKPSARKERGRRSLHGVILPRRLPNGLRAWTANHYNKAADSVMNAIGITPAEWGEVRAAIRDVLERRKSKR